MRPSRFLIPALLSLAACEEVVYEDDPDIDLRRPGTITHVDGLPPICGLNGEVLKLGRGFDSHVAGNGSGFLVAWAEESDSPQPFTLSKFSTLGEPFEAPQKLLRTSDGVEFVTDVGNGFLVSSLDTAAGANPAFLTRLDRNGDPRWAISGPNLYAAGAAVPPVGDAVDARVVWTEWRQNQNGDFATARIGDVIEADVINADLLLNGDAIWPTALAIMDNGTSVIGVEVHDFPGSNWYELKLKQVPGPNAITIHRNYTAIGYGYFNGVYAIGDRAGAVWTENRRDGSRYQAVTWLDSSGQVGTETPLDVEVHGIAAAASRVAAAVSIPDAYDVELALLTADGRLEALHQIEAEPQYFVSTPKIARADDYHYAIAWAHLLPSSQSEVKVAFINCHDQPATTP